MTMGARGERLACKFLQRQGLVLIETNFRLRFGEIDLIMWDQDCLVFVEVKYRSSERYGSTLEQVTLGKQRKIKLVATAYLKRLSGKIPPVRFDVVGIIPRATGYRYSWVKGAFE